MRPNGLVRVLAAAAALAALVFTAPVSSPPVVSGVGTLPVCHIDDILTEPRGYDDWSTTLVDWMLSVGPDYKPPDLVSVQKAGIAGGGLVRAIAIDDLRALADAARKHGTPIAVFSPYRSYQTQVDLFAIYDRAYDNALDFSQRPGHSEHQLGLAIDFITKGAKGFTSAWESQPAGKWMAAHAWEYGWVMSYPKDKFDIVCFNYEPWHYRYVGREMAKKIHDSGLTVREYLWANFTQVDPQCAAQAVASIAPRATPQLRSCAVAVASGAPTATPGASGSGPAPPTPPGSSGPAGTPLASPSPTSTPGTSNAGTLFGLDPVLVLVLAAVVLVVGGLFFATRRPRRRNRAR
jgi:D-alanyl-D-alanine carboxypeptidase